MCPTRYPLSIGQLELVAETLLSETFDQLDLAQDRWMDQLCQILTLVGPV